MVNNLDKIYEDIMDPHKTLLPVNELSVDSLHLADVTIRAVDQIGENAAKEVEALADELRKEAESVAVLLDDLATAMRAHSIQASQHVAEFVGKTKHMAEVVRGLEEKLKATGEVA